MDSDKYGKPIIYVPMTKEELIARALESEKDIKEGKFISLEELEKEMKNW